MRFIADQFLDFPLQHEDDLFVNFDAFLDSPFPSTMPTRITHYLGEKYVNTGRDLKGALSHDLILFAPAVRLVKSDPMGSN